MQRATVLALSCIVLAAGIFFFRLFWPEPSLIITPDFGRSDVWHFSFPTKYALGEALQDNRLPLWSPSMGTGFPLLGEGQTGIFYLPNLILFRLLPQVTAYNLSLLLVFILFGTGMYFYLRYLRVHPVAACCGGLTFMFGGLTIAQIPHITLLQAFSLFPWIVWGAHAFADRPSLRKGAVLAWLISQQIFTGFPQATFITLLTAGAIGIGVQSNQFRRVLTLGGYSVIAAAAVLLSMVQLLPSYEFLQQIGGTSGFNPRTATYFSFPPSHLISLINPFALGNPQDGSYPPFYQFNGSIFWENTVFIGFVPLALWFFLLRERRRLEPGQRRLLVVLGVITAAAVLLMFGSHSPFYFVFSIWPFNLFRAPARFLWVVLFSGTVFSTAGAHVFISQTPKKSLAAGIIGLMLVVNLGHLWQQWWQYHPYERAADWLTPPETAADRRAGEAVYSIGAGMTHNRFFLQQGWTDMAPYRWLKNSLDPSAPLIWHIPTTTVYAGRFLHRQTVADALLQQAIPFSTAEATVSATGRKILDLMNVGTVLSMVELRGEPLTPVRTLTYGDQTLRVYHNDTAVPFAYIATASAQASTIEEAQAIITDPSFSPGTSVLLEEPLALDQAAVTAAVTVRRQEAESLQLATSTDGAGILVLNQTYYPGWKARIDGNPTRILPANIRQQAIVVPTGEHIIDVEYQPDSLRSGILISGAAHLLLMAAVAFDLASARSRTVRNIPGPSRRRPGSRGR